MKPLVSICIPTYNSAQYIRATLNSLINQDYENYEIIIGDNASNDNTLEAILDIINNNENIKYYNNNNNIGYSGNCNKLISLASGEFVAIYHSDDIYEKSIISKQVKLLTDIPNLVACFCRSELIDENGNKISNHKRKNSFKQYDTFNHDEFLSYLIEKVSNPIVCPTSMVKKKLYLDIGGYDESLKYIEDQDMWLRLLSKGDIGILNESLISYRIHGNQVSSFYKKPTRQEMNPMIKHVDDYVLKMYGRKLYNDKYKEKINRMEAVDLLRLAYYASCSNCRFSTFSTLIFRSKEKYSFSIKDGFKFMLFQKMGLLFYIVNTVFGKL